MRKRLSSQAAQASVQQAHRLSLNCRKGYSTKYLIQKDNKTELQIVSLVHGFFQSLSVYRSIVSTSSTLPNRVPTAQY